MGWYTKGLMSMNGVTGARTMAQHREMKRIQAENRNSMTPPERRSMRQPITPEAALAVLRGKLEQQAA